jgi:hypothetical protein
MLRCRLTLPYRRSYVEGWRPTAAQACQAALHVAQGMCYLHTAFRTSGSAAASPSYRSPSDGGQRPRVPCLCPRFGRFDWVPPV